MPTLSVLFGSALLSGFSIEAVLLLEWKTRIYITKKVWAPHFDGTEEMTEPGSASSAAQYCTQTSQPSLVLSFFCVLFLFVCFSPQLMSMKLKQNTYQHHHQQQSYLWICSCFKETFKQSTSQVPLSQNHWLKPYPCVWMQPRLVPGNFIPKLSVLLAASKPGFPDTF